MTFLSVGGSEGASAQTPLGIEFAHPIRQRPTQ